MLYIIINILYIIIYDLIDFIVLYVHLMNSLKRETISYFILWSLKAIIRPGTHLLNKWKKN